MCSRADTQGQNAPSCIALPSFKRKLPSCIALQTKSHCSALVVRDAKSSQDARSMILHCSAQMMDSTCKISSARNDNIIKIISSQHNRTTILLNNSQHIVLVYNYGAGSAGSLQLFPAWVDCPPEVPRIVTHILDYTIQ